MIITDIYDTGRSDYPEEYQKRLIRMSVEQGKLPAVLYKYREFNGLTHKLFEDHELWFSSPLGLNDPFDLQILDAEDWTREELITYLDAHKLDAIKQSVVLLQDAKSNNTYMKSVVENARQMMNKAGVLSLSKNPDHILMWSHYTRSHEGFVMGFSVLDDLDTFWAPSEVKYADEYPKVSYIRNMKDAVIVALNTKSNLWKYEDEYRVIKSKQQAFRYKPACLKEVILGARISPKNRMQVLNWLGRNEFRHVMVREASVAKYKYELELISFTTI